MTRYSQVGKVATSIITEDGFTEVIYHNTTVVKWNADVIILDTGGWETQTTKVRMNQASNQFGLDYRVYQEKGEWYVNFKGEVIHFDYTKVTLRRKEDVNGNSNG